MAATAKNGLSYPPVDLLQNNGEVIPTPNLSSTPWGWELYSGATFTAGQYSQVKFIAPNAVGNGTGPCVRMSASGQSYCYVADDAAIVNFSNGVWNTTMLSTCPVPANGDTIQLSAVNTTVGTTPSTILTCSDLTQGTSATVTASNSTYWSTASGAPGIFVDQRNSSTVALASFQADCIPSCSLGTVATPTFSPAAGTYASAQTVTIGDATSGATIYYTKNGITPTTSSTAYSGPITVSSSETV